MVLEVCCQRPHASLKSPQLAELVRCQLRQSQAVSASSRWNTRGNPASVQISRMSTGYVPSMSLFEPVGAPCDPADECDPKSCEVGLPGFFGCAGRLGKQLKCEPPVPTHATAKIWPAVMLWSRIPHSSRATSPRRTGIGFAGRPLRFGRV